MWRVTTLVNQSADSRSGDFGRQWLDVLAPAIAAAAKQDGRAHRIIVNVPPPEIDEKVAAVFPRPYDGLIEFWFESAQLAADGMRLLSAHSDLCNLAGSIVNGKSGVAWLAKAVLSKPEAGTAVKFLAAGDVAEGVALEDAQRYWAESHPKVAQTAPEVWEPLTRYTQFHGKPEPRLDMGDWLAAPRFVPMCSDMGFARQTDFIGVYTSDQYESIVRPDEETFSRPGEMLSFISVEERELLV